MESTDQLNNKQKVRMCRQTRTGSSDADSTTTVHNNYDDSSPQDEPSIQGSQDFPKASDISKGSASSGCISGSQSAT
eukprot:CAMPEP_0170197632 /NCGR_PEP_ID=MMETSP0040_2-20121228/66838_1 /TAXON_ID=641309 /ORGANISM="Lotharella oceanica, Strain CCMP622" /LENGTH=76 /DNA_ID=CAMNT_0010447349 /DNA_START=9 /DNA_END=236 /DNA_ORIENTATION=+